MPVPYNNDGWCFLWGENLPLIICRIVALSRRIRSLIEQRDKHSLNKKYEQTCNHSEEIVQCRKNVLMNRHQVCSMDVVALNGEK